MIDEWGRVIVHPNDICELLLKGVDVSSLLVEDTPQLEEYNSWCKKYDKLEYLLQKPSQMETTPEEEHTIRSQRWFISDEIKSIEVRDFVLSMCRTDEEKDRVNLEMDLFEERELIPLLQLMIFLVDSFRRNKVVFGVGRGSSVSSYVLYLIGIHKIDSMRFGLDVKDFLK